MLPTIAVMVLPVKTADSSRQDDERELSGELSINAADTLYR
jgi:hypothetical protein